MLLLYLLTLVGAKDEVHFLPPFNLSDYNFSIFSGYLQISSNQQQFHYVLVESELGTNNDSIPLVLWLNGGPGCSSLMGLFEEIGPFVFQDDFSNELSQNPYSWNKVAHLLFFESPSIVGFSKNPQNITFNDQQVANDNLAALEEFFSNYPNYQKNPLYIAGESYAGAYIPMLAVKINSFNAQGVAIINLKGILIGNGVTNMTQLLYTENVYLKQHNLITPTIDLEPCLNSPMGSKCKNITDEIDNNILKYVNPYDIYGYCFHKNNKFTRHHLTQSIKGVKEAVNSSIGEQQEIPCCQFENIEAYLNQENVKEALNVDPTIHWQLCRLFKDFHYDIDPLAGLSALKQLQLNGQYSITLYNGDSDSVVPWFDTLLSLQQLGLKIVEEWRPYYVNDNQLGGFIQSYDNNLRFLTVRGAGHMVPVSNRNVALYILENMLNGNKFNNQ